MVPFKLGGNNWLMVVFGITFLIMLFKPLLILNNIFAHQKPVFAQYMKFGLVYCFENVKSSISKTVISITNSWNVMKIWHVYFEGSLKYIWICDAICELIPRLWLIHQVYICVCVFFLFIVHAPWQVSYYKYIKSHTFFICENKLYSKL